MKDSTAIYEASRQTYWPHMVMTNRVNSATIAHAQRDAAQLGVMVKLKQPGAIYPESASALPLTIWLPHDWNSMHSAAQAEMLIHELVHVRDAQANGVLSWYVQYIHPVHRMIFEARAYAAGLQYLRSIDPNYYSDFRCKRLIAGRAQRVYDKYVWIKTAGRARRLINIFTKGMLGSLNL